MKDLISKIKDNWKDYSINGTIAVIFLLMGMGLTELDALKQVFITVLAGLLLKIPDYIMIFIGIIIISNSVLSLVKKIPEWIEDWEKRRLNVIRTERAALGMLRW